MTRGDVSRETVEKLKIYEDLVRKWTKSINLVSDATVGHIWDRHIQDSMQIIGLAPEDWQTWTDIGSGGGFPGIVVATMDSLKRPVTLIESDQRKCTFLRTVRRELDLNVDVICDRIENTDVPPADVLSARALASLDRLFDFVPSLLKGSGTALFMKGATYKEELDQAQQHWHFVAKQHQSSTNPDARILEIAGISRREP